MSHHFAALMLALLSVSTAQGEPRSAQPYAAVALVLPAPSANEDLIAFRNRLAAVARARIYGGLEPLVRDAFFWDRDFGNGFDPRKPAVDNLAAALMLEHSNGSGWKRLAALAAEPSAEPLAARPGVVCAPARPAYDGVAYARLLDATFTSDIDWAYPRDPETPVRQAPNAKAAVIETIGLHFVQLLGFENPDNAPAPARTQWARIATPGGRVGYVAPSSLMSLAGEQLCYTNDPVAGWRIAGYIAGGTWRKSQH